VSYLKSLHPEDIGHGPEPIGPRVRDVEALSGHRIRLLFDNGEVRIYDMTPYLERGVFRVLRDPAIFCEVFVDGGTAAWPGGLDVSPDMLYLDSESE